MLVVVKARPIEKQIFRNVFVKCDHWTKKVFFRFRAVLSRVIPYGARRRGRGGEGGLHDTCARSVAALCSDPRLPDGKI